MCWCVGAKGLLAEEEERLFRLRQEKEGQVRQELNRAREELEAEGRNSQNGKLCATPFGVDVVGITEIIALTGALVGGMSKCLPTTRQSGFVCSDLVASKSLRACTWVTGWKNWEEK